MFPDNLIEQARELIMQALANYQPSKSDDAPTLYISSGRRSIDDFRQERQDSPINANSTRRKGSAKLNCSEDVFEHLKVEKTIRKLPAHYQKWICYQYGEHTDLSLIPDLVEIIIEGVELPNVQARSKEHAKNLITRQVMTVREFMECRALQTKEIVEALGVQRRIAIKKYRPQSVTVSDFMKRFDADVLAEFYRLHMINDSVVLDHSSGVGKINQK